MISLRRLKTITSIATIWRTSFCVSARLILYITLMFGQVPGLAAMSDTSWSIDLSVEEIVEEIGDLLFAVANLARHVRVEPEDALRNANRKFSERSW